MRDKSLEKWATVACGVTEIHSEQDRLQELSQIVDEFLECHQASGIIETLGRLILDSLPKSTEEAEAYEGSIMEVSNTIYTVRELTKFIAELQESRSIQSIPLKDIPLFRGGFDAHKDRIGN